MLFRSATIAANPEEGKAKGLQQVIDAYEKQKAQIKDQSEAIKKQKTEEAARQRTFSFGWEKAFNEYVDQATNAAAQAQRVFDKATQGMEDAIVNFAKTGKFEFKSLIATITEELLRSQIRQLIANIFPSKASSGGGALTSI